MTMRRFTRKNLVLPPLAALVASAMIVGAGWGIADEGHGKKAAGTAAAKKITKKANHKPVNVRLYYPKMDAVKGMRLFVSKGCVACHAVNGVGGHDAKALDAHTMNKRMNPFEFVAKMWRMASPMIAAQEEAIGEQITFTGVEIAHIVAFVHDDAQQHKFTEAAIPPEIRKLMKHTHGAKPKHQGEIGHRKMQKR